MTITIPMWVLSALGPVAAVLLTWWLQDKRLKVIHDNTNSQLGTALKKIEDLQDELRRNQR